MTTIYDVDYNYKVIIVLILSALFLIHILKSFKDSLIFHYYYVANKYVIYYFWMSLFIVIYSIIAYLTLIHIALIQDADKNIEWLWITLQIITMSIFIPKYYFHANEDKE